MDIAIEGGEVVPRSVGEKIHPRQLVWWPLGRRIAGIPSAAYTGETPIHRAQKVLARLPGIVPVVPRPTPILDRLKGLLPRIAGA